MIEVRIHGRGGQGAVVASEILAIAGFYEGMFVQSFPQFGVERRGAPVVAFVKKVMKLSELTLMNIKSQAWRQAYLQ